MEDNKRKALGRGLEELFNIDDVTYGKLEEKIMETSRPDEVIELPLSELRVNPYQPRKNFDDKALNELSESIKEHGVFQPIIVKKSIKGYEIVAGERRYRASILAKKETIPAIIRDFSDEQMMEIALLENLQRENLNAVEEADAYRNLMLKLNLTQDEVARKVNKSRSHVTNMLGILSLPTYVKDFIAENKISMGHARVLSKLEDPKKIEELADRIVSENLSVREVEEIANASDYPRKNKITKMKQPSEYQDVESILSEHFGTKVKVINKKIIINYENDQDLNRILEIINIEK